MDIRFLTTFIEVVNTRHFGKAAENLYLTQSAVSARIKLLEEYFHTSLFVRNRNSIQLTPAGEQLLPYAQQLCATLNDARQALQQQAGEYIVCGATQLAGELALHDFVSDLCTSFPDYAIKAEVYSLDQVTRKLHERAVDIAFSSEPLKSEEVVCTELFNWPLGLFGSTADIEMTPEHYIAIDWGNKTREALLALYPECRDAHFRTNSLQLALHTHRREGGVLILPIELANQLAPDAHLLTPLNHASTSVYLSYMKSIRRGELNDIVAHLTRRTHE